MLRGSIFPWLHSGPSASGGWVGISGRLLGGNLRRSFRLFSRVGPGPRCVSSSCHLISLLVHGGHNLRGFALGSILATDSSRLSSERCYIIGCGDCLVPGPVLQVGLGLHLRSSSSWSGALRLWYIGTGDAGRTIGRLNRLSGGFRRLVSRGHQLILRCDSIRICLGSIGSLLRARWLCRDTHCSIHRASLRCLSHLRRLGRGLCHLTDSGSWAVLGRSSGRNLGVLIGGRDWLGLLWLLGRRCNLGTLRLCGSCAYVARLDVLRGLRQLCRCYRHCGGLRNCVSLLSGLKLRHIPIRSSRTTCSLLLRDDRCLLGANGGHRSGLRRQGLVHCGIAHLWLLGNKIELISCIRALWIRHQSGIDIISSSRRYGS
mmetsp:Transcript_1568/g.4069  ORF Transcript_1568/g.4069 Transcript_1568/m.4069 type:complete len:373 (-) Transcript_1568:90-1208(-)